MLVSSLLAVQGTLLYFNYINIKCKPYTYYIVGFYSVSFTFG